MKSLIIREASRYLITIIALYSVFLLIRGHNQPGGGFIGGLAAAAAWSLIGLAFDPSVIRKQLALPPHYIRAIGLLIMLACGIVPAFFSESFLEGQWLEIPLSSGEKMKLGSPLLFDFGVYLLVFGAMTDIVRIFEEHS